MLRTLLACGLCSLLFSGPARAQTPQEKQLDDIQKSLRALQAQLDIYQQNVRGDMNDMKRRVEELEIRMRALEQTDRDRARVARAFTPSAPVEIVMRNRSAFAVTVILDNRMTYDLLPGESRTASRDPGRFEYEVLMRNGMSLTNGRVVRVLSADQPFHINIDPTPAVPVIVNRPALYYWPY